MRRRRLCIYTAFHFRQFFVEYASRQDKRPILLYQTRYPAGNASDKACLQLFRHHLLFYSSMKAFEREWSLPQKPSIQIRRALKVFFQKNPAGSIASISKFREATIYPAPLHVLHLLSCKAGIIPWLVEYLLQSAFHNKCAYQRLPLF